MESQHLTVRPLLLTDHDGFMASIDDEVCRWQGYGPGILTNLHENFADTVSERWRRRPVNLSVLERASGEFLGAYRIGGISGLGRWARLGWWLGAAGRGRGLGSESLPLVLRYAHRSLGLKSVVMGTSRENVRALAMIHRVQAVLIDEREHALPNGETIEGLFFEHARSQAT
jgi:RimJ/RimL family protein N-acetyltransferase